jgi:MFS transporter, DHA1 family, tetracycline resistance protein
MLQPFYTFLSFVRDIGEESFEILLKKPFFHIGQHGLKVKGMFAGIQTRQAVTIYVGILWVIPIVIAQPYVYLYANKLGLSETEVGVYQSLMSFVGLFFFFVGGYFSDTWGRKRTLIFFDTISWEGYCLCLALASNKWWCIAAIFFMATNAASGPPYLSLLSEGVPAKNRAFVFTVLTMANMAPALLFLPLLGGIWINKAGFISANHQMYWLHAALVGLGIFLRWKLLPESEVYEKSAESWFHALKEAFRQYRQALRAFFQKRMSRTFLFSKFLDEWILFVWATYSSLYYVKFLGLKASYLSILSPLSTYVAFLSLFLVLPNLTEKFMMRILGFDQLFGLAAMTVLLLLSRGGKNVLLVCLMSSGLAAVGTAFYGSVSAAVWMNIMEERERAKVVAASYALIRVGLFLTGSFGALLYGKVSPLSLLWVMIGIRVVGFILLRRVANRLAPQASV